LFVGQCRFLGAASREFLNDSLIFKKLFEQSLEISHTNLLEQHPNVYEGGSLQPVQFCVVLARRISMKISKNQQIDFLPDMALHLLVQKYYDAFVIPSLFWQYILGSVCEITIFRHLPFFLSISHSREVYHDCPDPTVFRVVHRASWW
jgi:hypothetical protein